MFVCILKDEIGTVDYYCATRISRDQQGAARCSKQGGTVSPCLADEI